MRGDTYLWTRLGQRFAEVPMPTSLFGVRDLVRYAIIDEVGIDIDRDDRDDREGVYVKELSTGSGISDGNVLPRWWKHTGVPILVDRWGAATGQFI